MTIDKESQKRLFTFEKWHRKGEWSAFRESYETVKDYKPFQKTQDEIQELIQDFELNYDFPPHYSGVFISYCVNEVYPEKEIEIEIGMPFSFLGLNTKKKWKIIGDTGDIIGYEMYGGKIEVIGNVGNRLGENMKDGKIVVRGCAGDWIGEDMSGGTITIEGNAGQGVGYGMTGGKIFLNRHYDSLTNCHKSGEIYHRGLLTLKDGKKIEY